MFPRHKQHRGAWRGNKGALWESSPAPALPYLELDHFLCGETQVHAVTALELEGTLVELGDGLVHVQHGILLHHLPDDLRAAASPGWHRRSEPWSGQLPLAGRDGAYQGRQGDAGGCADQLDHGAVADVPFPQGELAPGAALVGWPGRREAESPPRAAGEQVNLARHRSGRAPAALLLLSLLCTGSLFGETTIPWEPSTGEQDGDAVPWQGHRWKQCGQECCWALASSRQVTCLDL